MSFYTPLGFLGLLALAVLILIYIIKQNFQQKIVSSTFVWRLSIKYRKKRLPMSKFRELLVFICQVLAFTVCAFILAWPVISGDITSERNEKILIIDGGANMLALYENTNETRFERAVSQARLAGADAISKTGLVTVIVAGAEATVEIARTDSVVDLNAALDKLIIPNSLKCSYGIADVSGAMSLSEAVLIQNSLSEVIFYTATTYASEGDVTVVSVSEQEWNVAIVDARVLKTENFYDFEIEVASYNRDVLITVDVTIMDAVILDADSNEKYHEEYFYSWNGLCSGGNIQVIEIKERIASYSEVRISIPEDDSFANDNEMYLYDNKRETINILYTSSLLNPFVDGGLMAIRGAYGKYWDIEIDTLEPVDEEYTLSGYDFYIFEGEMPGILPTDGVVIIIDPDKTAAGMGLIIEEEMQVEGQGINLSKGITHPITEVIGIESVIVTRYRRVSSHDSFVPLLYCADDPVLLVKNELESRVAVLNFSMHYSDLSVNIMFPWLFANVFNYYLPRTVRSTMYSVGDNVEIRCRGLELEVGKLIVPSEPFTTFPKTVKVLEDGSYTVVQTLLSGGTSSRSFFVRIPKSESDFSKVELELANPYIPPGVGEPLSIDLLIFLAAGLVALLFLEWWLQSREQT